MGDFFMGKVKQLTFEDNNFKSFVNNESLVIAIKQNVFEIVTDMAESNYLIDLFYLAEENPSIKAIFLYNEPEVLGVEVYENYINNLITKDKKDSPPFLTDDSRQTIRSRQIAILNHLIEESLNLKKLFIVGLQGSIVTPFFGASLAADLRFASDDMFFSLTHLKFGIHPSGALPFFLPKYIGNGRAKQLLFSRENITSQQALELGIINYIFPQKTFLEDSLRELEKITQLDMNVIRTTKKLMKLDNREIQNYFDQESKIALF